MSSDPLDLWYEGPTVVVADKPATMAVYPERPVSTGTLVNSLLGQNRWLADMETSRSPGVIHHLAREDRGLVVVAKSEEEASILRQRYAEEKFLFSYRVQIPQGVTPLNCSRVTVLDHQEDEQGALYDIDSVIGDTRQLRHEWLGDSETSAYFVAYRVRVPAAAKTLDIGLGTRITLPAIDLYTAPP